MTSLKQFVLVCLISACVFSCKKDSNSVIAEDTANSYAQFVDAMKFQGLATGNMLVYENGEVIFKSSNGLRAINPIDSLDLNSQFRLASVSKQFTGMAIMKLKEAGKLDYDQKVNTILKEFPYDNISVRQLLHHTSGLTDYERLIAENFKPEDTTKTYILGNVEILDLFFSVNPELDFQPGEKWEYSNTGYLVLATVVERISGQHLRDFLKEQVFDPVGMTNTSVYKYQIEPDPKMPNRVFGYEMALNQKDLVANDYNIVNDVRGDGGMYSTLDDLYKWNMALANATIISQDYLDEAWTPGKLNNGEDTDYGFGWFLESKEGEPKVVNHSGGWVGFVTFLHNEVDAKSGFILLTNDSGANFRSVFDNIQNLRKGKPFAMPKISVYNDMAKLTFESGVDDAVAWYHKVKSDTVAYAVNEQDINRFGYGLLNEDRIDDALKIFELNTKEYPESANPYDSYADALILKGDSLKALENYKRCFKMDSTLTYAQDKADALEKALGLTK